MAAEIEEEAAAARKRTGAEPLGVAAILSQDPTNRPKRLKKSPAPLFHAASKARMSVARPDASFFQGESTTRPDPP